MSANSIDRELPTMRVYSEEHGQVIIINVEDFDKAKHVPEDEYLAKAAKKSTGKKKDE